MKQRRRAERIAIRDEVRSDVTDVKVGRTVTVIIDRKEGDYYVGRTEACSPEVDPEVLIPASERMLRAGTFYQVRITNSDEYDLYGTVI